MVDVAHPLQALALAQDLHALLSRMKRRLREQAQPADVTPSQASVVLRLEKDGPATASALARAEGMRPQSMAAVVAGLEALNLINGAPHPTDGRQTLLSLTEPCRKWLAQSRAARQDWLSQRIESRLSPREQFELASAMSLLRRLVED